MILRIEDIQEVCSKLLNAVDSSSSFTINETLELKTEDKSLYLSVTNREYYVRVKIALFDEEEFHATVNANVFLKLMSQITTDTVELTTEDNSLIIKGNGTYKLPMIYEGENLLELPKIEVNNITSNFTISTTILDSILNYNSKELNKGVFSKPVQKMYYVDEKGCITFTTGACVNSFSLSSPIKVLLNTKVVKLFKLFTSDNVTFDLAQDAVNEEIIQTKVRFKADNVELTSVINSDDNMVNSVPVDAIRKRATDTYPNSVVLNKNAVIQSINRLLLFSDNKEVFKPYSTFEFTNDNVTIWDRKKENKEIINYENSVETLSDTYSATLDLNDIKLVLDGCKEEYVTLNFGNSQAVVVQRPNVYNVIPECHLD